MQTNLEIRADAALPVLGANYLPRNDIKILFLDFDFCTYVVLVLKRDWTGDNDISGCNAHRRDVTVLCAKVPTL